MLQLDTLYGLLAQVPLVGIFIWFTLNMLKSFQASITEQRREFLASLQLITSQMEGMNKQMTLLNERLCKDQKQSEKQ